MKSVLLFVLSCLIGFSGNAKVREKSDVTDSFLSYTQFQALTPKEQISYIKDIREFVHELTKENDSFARSSQGQALYAMLSLFQSEARADFSDIFTGEKRYEERQKEIEKEKQEEEARVRANADPRGEKPTENPTADSGNTSSQSGGGWFTRLTNQDPAPVDFREVSKPTMDKPPTPPNSATQIPTAPTKELSPAQVLVNEWNAEGVNPKKRCPGGKVGNMSKLSNFDLMNLIEAGIRACTTTPAYVGVQEKLNYRGVYQPAAAENFIAVADEIQRRSRLNYSGREKGDFGEAVNAMQRAFSEFNDPEHQPPKGSYNAAKIADSEQQNSALMTKLIESGQWKGSGYLVESGQVDSVGGSRTQPRTQSKFPVASSSGQKCIAAGFVNMKTPQGKCPFISNLSRELFFVNGDSSKFACAKKGEVICNPFLYGNVLACSNSPGPHQVCIRQPLCVAPSVASSEACFIASRDKNSLLNIQQIWMSPSGRAQYEAFVKSIKDLCREAAAGGSSKSSDVKKTCKVALKTLAERVHSEYESRPSVPSPQPSSSNASPTSAQPDREAEKANAAPAAAGK